ncbi:hypothetical protein HanRHA438_Chr11g0500351 [Helianthus annuus]|nr:hypothetical protein HanRHA438_Chr11g0500351 [Helianthus annuus]
MCHYLKFLSRKIKNYIRGTLISTTQIQTYKNIFFYTPDSFILFYCGFLLNFAGN